MLATRNFCRLRFEIREAWTKGFFELNSARQTPWREPFGAQEPLGRSFPLSMLQDGTTPSMAWSVHRQCFAFHIPFQSQERIYVYSSVPSRRRNMRPIDTGLQGRAGNRIGEGKSNISPADLAQRALEAQPYTIRCRGLAIGSSAHLDRVSDSKPFEIKVFRVIRLASPGNDALPKLARSANEDFKAPSLAGASG